MEPLHSNVVFEQTVNYIYYFQYYICKCFPRSDLRFYGIPQSFINVYYNQYHISSVLPWQSELFSSNADAVLKGKNIVYCAPTGVGKSLVYEICMIRRILYWKGQCLLLLPYISLIEEKKKYFEDLCETNGLFVECFYSSGSQCLDPHIDVRNCFVSELDYYQHLRKSKWYS